VESYHGHFQAECLNHFLCFSLGQLDRICALYGRYYNDLRPHQSLVIGNRVLDKNWQPPQPVGTVKRTKIFGGLLNHYYRDAG